MTAWLGRSKTKSVQIMGCFPQKKCCVAQPCSAIVSRLNFMKNNKYWFWVLVMFGSLLGSTGSYGSEADIKIPALDTVKFEGLGGIHGSTLMYVGILICFVGAIFGLVQYKQTKALP